MSKYVKEMEFLSMDNSQGSKAWHGIKLGKDVVRFDRCWIIGLSNILALKEPWLPLTKDFILKLKLGIAMDFDLKVANLILNNQRFGIVKRFRDGL